MYYIDFTACVLTQLCYDECPVNAITIASAGGETPTIQSIFINEDECISCGLCAEICPVGAIWGNSEGGGTGDWDDPPVGGGGITTPDEIYDTGLLVINELESDLNNNKIVAIEHNGEEFLIAADIALQCKNMSLTLINALKASDPLIRSLGVATGIAGGALGALSFIIGATDGEISPSDWATGVAASLGIGAVIFVTAPAWATVLGVGSIVIGITSYILPGDS